MKYFFLIISITVIITIVSCNSDRTQTYKTDTYSIDIPTTWEFDPKYTSGNSMYAVLRTDTSNNSAWVQIEGANNVIPGTDKETEVLKTMNSITAFYQVKEYEGEYFKTLIAGHQAYRMDWTYFDRYEYYVTFMVVLTGKDALYISLIYKDSKDKPVLEEILDSLKIRYY